MGTRRLDKVMKLQVYLEHVCAEIRDNGWLSVTKANNGQGGTGNATASKAYWRAQYKQPIALEDMQLSEKAIEWARSRLSTEAYNLDFSLTEYDLKLYAAVRNDYLEYYEDMLVAGSLIVTYQRRIAKEEDVKRSKHIGEVGYPLQIHARLARSIPFDTFDKWKKDWVHKYTHTFYTDEGCMLVWFNEKELKVGTKYAIDCHVAKHGEYQGVAQTVLHRIKSIEEAGCPTCGKLRGQCTCIDIEFSYGGRIWNTDIDIEVI